MEVSEKGFWYAANYFVWATATTKEEVIEKIKKHTVDSIKFTEEEELSTVLVWIGAVEEGADFKIMHYVPVIPPEIESTTELETLKYDVWKRTR